MNQNPRELARRFIDFIWRRRKLLYLPALIMVPLSIVIALAMPRTYVARTLLLLQETSGNPLTRDRKEAVPAGAIAERTAGLQALMRSDRVLGAALRDILGETTPENPKVFAAKLKELESQLTLELVGDDFLEIKLKGDHARGLGKDLSSVVGRFLEGLMPTSNMTTATQVILDRRTSELKTAEADYAAFMKGPAGAILASREDLVASNKAVAGKLASIKERMDILDTALDQANRLAAAEAEAAPGAAAAGRPSEKAQALAKEVSELTAQRNALAKEAAASEQQRNELAPRFVEIEKVERQRRQLEQAVVEARAMQQAYSRRSANMSRGAAIGVLNAPERIRVIDAPEDPVFPLHTRTRLVIAVLLASLVFGAGLAFTTELLDDTVRTADDVEAAAGVPVRGQLPRETPCSGQSARVAQASAQTSGAQARGAGLAPVRGTRTAGGLT